MDCKKWTGAAFDTDAEFQEFVAEAQADLEQQLKAVGLVLYKTLNMPYTVDAVAATADGKKFLHVKTVDVRADDQWAEKVCMHRMSSERDWKGEDLYYCAWNELGEQILKYMDDQYNVADLDD